MMDQSAKGLRLSAGVPARLMDASGAPHDASSNALTRQEILQLVGPIIPEHARRRLPQEASVEFDHVSPSGAFKVTILRNGSEIAVNIVPDPNAKPAAAATPAAAPAAAPAAPPAAAAPAVQEPRIDPGAPAIDRLFHLMV